MSLLAPLSVNSFALLFVSHMAVEKKISKGLSRICEVLLTRGQTGRNLTHKDGATNYSICRFS